jgi:hypothetical protein
MKGLPSFQNFRENEKSVKESKDVISTIDADKFISEVLKMGSRDNMFDKFMKKEKINSNELTPLVNLVAQRLIQKWT